MLDSEDTELVHKRRVCPDCRNSLREGPHGGLSVNWYCVEPGCGSRFNDMGVFGVERLPEDLSRLH